MENQVKSCANTLMNPLLCGFREEHSSQNAFLCFVENFKKAVDNGMSTGAVFVDLCKAFDFLNQDLLIILN